MISCHPTCTQWEVATETYLPLDRDLYSPKLKFTIKKPPLKIVITEANSKIARHLMYKICSGEVFGPDQEVILHLTCSKGKTEPKSVVSELYLCGFPLFLDAVINSDPQKVYKNVDLVVTFSTFQELPGHSNYRAFLHQVFFTLQVAKNMVKYAKKGSKLVICGPSTKGSITLLTIIRRANMKIRYENVSGVTILDETITKSLIAAKLKTTTTQIKNVVIWGSTHADIRNGTVFTYPPEDRGCYKKVDVPLVDALQDDNWLQCDLLKAIHSRVIAPHLVSHGTAVAAAAATHLKLLFKGSDSLEETVSMGVIIPSSQPYGLSEIGFSLPVTTKNGRITIKENVPLEVYSYLTNLKDEYNLTRGKLNVALRVLQLFSWLSIKEKQDFKCLEKRFPDKISSLNTKFRYILCSIPEYENHQKPRRQSVGFDKFIPVRQTSVKGGLKYLKKKPLLKFLEY